MSDDLRKERVRSTMAIFLNPQWQKKEARWNLEFSVVLIWSNTLGIVNPAQKKKKVSETPPCTALEMRCVSWHLLQLCEVINACPEAVGLLQGTQRDRSKRFIIKPYYFGHFLIWLFLFWWLKLHILLNKLFTISNHVSKSLSCVIMRMPIRIILCFECSDWSFRTNHLLSIGYKFIKKMPTNKLIVIIYLMIA